MRYCKNCGVQLDPKCSLCVHCGCPRTEGQNFCPICAFPLPPGTAYCLHCGGATTLAPAKPTTPGTSVASLVLGILSLICCFPVVDLILGIIALVCAAKSKKVLGNRDGLATAGFVCGIIGVVMGAMYTFYTIIYALMFGTLFFLPFLDEFGYGFSDYSDAFYLFILNVIH